MLCLRCGRSLEKSDRAGKCETCEAVSQLAKVQKDTEVNNPKLTKNLGVAGFWLRIGASLIDGAIISIFALIFKFIISFTMKISLASFFQSRLISETVGYANIVLGLVFTLLITFLFFLVYAFVISFLYFPLFEYSRFGGTPGKIIMGLRIKNSDGRNISLIKGFFRHFSRYVNLMFLFVGVLMLAFTKHNQALHDYVTNTFVIKTKRINPYLAVSYGAFAILVIVILHMIQPDTENAHQHNSINNGNQIIFRQDSLNAGSFFGSIQDKNENTSGDPQLAINVANKHIKDFLIEQQQFKVESQKEEKVNPLPDDREDIDNFEAKIKKSLSLNKQKSK